MADLYEIAQKFRQQVIQRQAAAITAILDRYRHVWRQLEADLDRVTEKIAAAQEQGEPASLAWEFQRNRLESFKRQLAEEIGALSRYAADITRQSQIGVTKLSQPHAEAMLEAAQSQIGIQTSFTRLPKEALQKFVGLAANGSPLKESFERLARDLGGDTDDFIEKTIADGILLGYNPRKIASLIKKGIHGEGLSPRIVRRLGLATHSSVLWSYRESSRETYQENGVEQWYWSSAKSNTTCAACWAMDGKVFDTNTPLGSHPHCRCTMIPLLEGDTPQTNGEQEFADLSDDEQREILGKAKFEAYKSGDIVLLEDLVKVKSRNKWGTQRTEDGLIAALGKDLARQYANGETFDTFDGELYRAERRIVDREYEVGLVFDRDGKLLMRKHGLKDTIQFSDEELKTFNQQVFTHNHPRGTSFSLRDFQFAKLTNLRQLRVISRDILGRQILFEFSVEFDSSDQTFKWPDLQEEPWKRIISQSNAKAQIILETKLINGEISEKEYSQLLNDFVWKEFVSRYNALSQFKLIYRKVVL